MMTLFSRSIRFQLVLPKQLDYLMGMKELYMNLDFIVLFKNNMMMMTMVKMMLLKTIHLEIYPRYYLYPG